MRDEEMPTWNDAAQALGYVLLVFVIVALVAMLVGCGFKIPPCILDGTCPPRPTAGPTVTATAFPTTTEAPNPTATATAVPAPTSWSAVPPEPAFVNGCDAANPHSVGADGECGFTIFYHCPGCTRMRAWPADQDHAHWTPPADDPLVFVDDQGHGHAAYGACPTTGDPESIATCTAVKGREWPATCASVGSFVVSLYPGNVRLDVKPGRNCYAGIIAGHGEYRVCLPAGARACKDPRDYMGDADWVNGCTHGEVILTEHAICSGPYRVDR